VVAIMQRLHERDLIGHIEDTCAQDNWTFVKVPAEAEQNERVIFPLSGRVVERTEGDILWPEREGPAELAAMKERLGSYGYAGQYQQRPVPVAGGMFHRDWFKIVDQVPAGMEQQVRHWDLAATEATQGRDPDYTASARVGLKDGRYYITSVDRDRLSPLGVEQLVKQWAQVDGQRVKIAMEQEPGSSGVNTIDHYARVVLVGYNFHGVRTTGSKVERALVLAAAAEAGNVYLLKAPWNEAFLDEISVAPMGRHDDQWDAAAGAVNDLAQPTYGGWNG
jgi:predicted phage terminase large subunit-like protein